MSDSFELEFVKNEKECDVLGGIAKKYSADSAERRALRKAAFALNFVNLRYLEEFLAFVAEFERIPTPGELRKIDDVLRSPDPSD